MSSSRCAVNILRRNLALYSRIIRPNIGAQHRCNRLTRIIRSLSWSGLLSKARLPMRILARQTRGFVRAGKEAEEQQQQDHRYGNQHNQGLGPISSQLLPALPWLL